MYVSDVGKDLPIFDIMEPYLIVLVTSVAIFFCLYMYMKIMENTQGGSNTDEDDDLGD